MLNGKNTYDPANPYAKPLNPDAQLLYSKYKTWGLIGKDEMKGGWHPYVRGGITYDTRDKRQGPNKGIYTDAFFTYSAAFNAAYGDQASAGYNHLQFNFTFRHYVPCYVDKKGIHRITFAYRIGTQNLIAGRSPFYMNNYLNALFIQRVYYEGLGGGNSVRGMMAHRILANGFAYANVEFRFRVVNFDIGRQHFFIGLNPFFDLGMITQPYNLNDLVKMHTKDWTTPYTTLQESMTAAGDSYEAYFKTTDKNILLALRDELTLRMRELIIWVPDDEHYEENIAKLLPPKKRLPRWVAICLAVVLFPLFALSLCITFPLWGMWLLIQKKIKDPAFHNSVQFVWQLVFLTLTLLIPLPFWMFVQEYVYQLKIENL